MALFLTGRWTARASVAVVIRSLASLTLAAALAGCATSAASRAAGQRRDAAVVALQTEVETVREAGAQAQDAADRAQDDLRSLALRVNDLERSASDAHQEIARLRGLLAELEGTRRRSQAEAESRSGSAAKAPAAPAPAPPAPAAPAPAVSSSAAPVSAAPAPPVPAPAPTARVPTPDAMYATALELFRAGEHGQAVLELLDFLARYPRHALAPNAQYWIGEAYYAQRDWRQALAEFEKVLDQYGRSVKAADALLMMGRCHTNLNEGGRAQVAWERLLQEYPASDAATRARSLLRAGRPAARR